MNKSKPGFISIEYVLVATIVLIVFGVFSQTFALRDSARFQEVANRVGDVLPFLNRRPIVSPPNRDSCFSINSAGVIYSYALSCGSDVVIPSSINGISVVAIGPSAFMNMNVSRVVFPDSITTIDTNAFRGNRLLVVTIPSRAQTIGANAFADNLISGLFIPSSVIHIGEGAFDNNLLPPEIAIIYARTSGGINRSKIVSYGGFAERVNIPFGVNEIATNAFRDAGIVELTIPATVTSIHSFAFANNPLSSVLFMGAPPAVGNSIFLGNLGFTNINIEVMPAYLAIYRSRANEFGVFEDSFFSR